MDSSPLLAQNKNEERKEKIYTSFYERVNKIGSGGFGAAFLIMSKKHKLPLVLKEVDLTDMDEDEIQDAMEEASILKLFDHPNIIKIKDVFKTRFGVLNIIMEFAPKGDLNAIIEEKKKRLDNFDDKEAYFKEEEIMDIAGQVLVAMVELHSKNLIHRDIKSHNIFLMENMQVKLGDFGLAAVLDNTKTIVDEVLGTPWYLSPETCKGGEFTFKSDIWALGVVLYRMCSLRWPFDHDGNASTMELYEQIMTVEPPPIPDHYSPFL